MGLIVEKEAELTQLFGYVELINWLAKSKDSPIAHWGGGVRWGQIFGFDGFPANSKNLCLSND